MTNLPPKSRVKGNDRSNTKNPGFVLNKTEDLNNIVVMSGSAKRRRLETEETPPVRISQQDFTNSFVKLRAPFCKSYHKQAQSEERIMTKSCEVLLECIKPYKEIRMARRTQVTESTRILTTDVVYERKATRNVQFVRFSNENQSRSVFSNRPSMITSAANSDSVLEKLDDEGTYTEFHGKTEPDQTTPGTAVSSEDFITKVFIDPDSSSIFT